MPFKRYEDMNFMRHAKHLGMLKLDKNILRRLTAQDKKEIREVCRAALEKNFGE